jgi:hypothetical protein
MSLISHAHDPVPGSSSALRSTTHGPGVRHPLHEEPVLLSGSVIIVVVVLACIGWRAQEISVLLAALAPVVGYRYRSGRKDA